MQWLDILNRNITMWIEPATSYKLEQRVQFSKMKKKTYFFKIDCRIEMSLFSTFFPFSIVRILFTCLNELKYYQYTQNININIWWSNAQNKWTKHSTIQFKHIIKWAFFTSISCYKLRIPYENDSKIKFFGINTVILIWNKPFHESIT